ncbi:VOC family protein [Mycobacterium bourgelatii]|uniref:VOC domain-containing protein n=1 Tax=Mycobacterium bourgelatii TaxID=1273442 RepID=A0A7I9YQY6_MYCBU|nr:VOC family protein [Mycobacterium bourgelatii]MCV6973970.1 VOC family protein [Mycobacterium bourgelatii]GFG90903.1 hypothetical protein MBOU_29450 [Mycobacterium bourgelatii]
MQPHVDVITLGVADLDRSLAFYRSFGWETDGIVGTEFPGSQTEPAGRAAMFKLRDGLMLSLYPASELAKDAGVDIAAVSGHGFSLGHIVSSRHDVEKVLATAQAAGGHQVGTVGERPWGIYSGYFRDPDGHLWEVIYFLASDQN